MLMMEVSFHFQNGEQNEQFIQKEVTKNKKVPFIANNRNVQDAGRGAVLGSVTHFNAFLANFRRHFGTFKKMATLSVF